jgi:hypothetical protein
VAGVIYNPASDELFWAEKGVGAFLNDRRLRVSGGGRCGGGLRHRHPLRGRAAQGGVLLHPASLMPQVAGVRRFGSAALDLAWVAAGRYDGFWELGLNKWDIAAGLVMVREAGGFVTDPDGGDPYARWACRVGNPALQPKLREVVAEGIAAVKARQRRDDPRGARCLALLLAPLAARAQDAPAELPDPAPAPPAPPALAPTGAPGQGALAPRPARLPAGLEPMPRVACASRSPPAACRRRMAAALAGLGRRLAALPAGRITVEAQVSGRRMMPRWRAAPRWRAPGGEGGAGRRRAGRDADRSAPAWAGWRAGADRVDVLPPGAASPTAESRGR